MNTRKTILSVIAIAFLTSIGVRAENPADSTKQYFHQAFDEVKNMLEGKQPMNFEKAVFITENAYWENHFSYENFQKELDRHTFLIRKLIHANNREASQNFKTTIDFNAPKFDITALNYTEKEKMKMYRKALANWAIYTYMTDTVNFYNFNTFPYRYQISDPFGMKDWKNSQVLNLLISLEQKGNCFAITSLFKILSERLNSEAYICIAPQHIYIQHKDHKGDYYNVELATGTHPGDGSIQTLTYTHREAIISGIALRRLNLNETIALCIVNLGKSYEHKYGAKDDDFILQCAELALKYDALSLNAMLLKEQVLEEKVIKYAAEKNISDINQLKIEKNIAPSYKKLEAQIVKLYDLGYRQMPRYMQEMILTRLQRKDDQPIMVQNRTPNPFTSIKTDKEDVRYSTLSGGIFEEVHTPKKNEQYGRIVLNIEKRKIVKFESDNNFDFLIDPVVFAWSVDPLAHQFPDWSPYAAFNDNPVYWVDPTGAAPDDYYTDRTGSINTVKTDDKFDRFFVQTGLDNSYSQVAQLDKNDAGLVQFPANGTGFTRYGTDDAGGKSTKPKETVGQGDHYIQSEAAAALFGLVNELHRKGKTISFGDMSSSSGSDPWQSGSKHHGGHGHLGKRTGLDVDFRYITNTGSSFQDGNRGPWIKVGKSGYFNDIGSSLFSASYNQDLYNTAKTFGLTKNYQGRSGNLLGVPKAGGHNDHGHLGLNYKNLDWKHVQSAPGN